MIGRYVNSYVEQPFSNLSLRYAKISKHVRTAAYFE